jgi:hypothetical protein
MTQRGRKSFEGKLSVVPFVAPLLDVPECLSASEGRIFSDMAAAMPAGWFRADSIPLLIEFSRAVDACNKLAAMRDTPDISMRDLAALLSAHEKQARLVINLATKMRLTQQSRILPDQAGRDVVNKPVLQPPWSGGSATSIGSKTNAGAQTAS